MSMLSLSPFKTDLRQLVVVTTTDSKLVKTLINEWHSMRTAPAGWRVAFVLTDGVNIYGVSTFGRPVARCEDQVHTLEHSRMALGPQAPRNSASYFMSRCRAWIRKNMPEIKRLISYVPTREYTGVTYRADNWSTIYADMPKRASWQNRTKRTGIANQFRTKYERVP